MPRAEPFTCPKSICVWPFQGSCANLSTVAIRSAGSSRYTSSSTTTTGRPSPGDSRRLKGQLPSGSPQ